MAVALAITVVALPLCRCKPVGVQQGSGSAQGDKEACCTITAAMTTLHWALRGIGDSLAKVAHLDFSVTEARTGAALSGDELFEGHLIREAEDTELGLFRPTRDEQIPLGDSLAEVEPVAAPDDAGTWQIGRRQAPTRSKALFQEAADVQPTSVGVGDAAVAKGNLLAAARLTQV